MLYHYTKHEIALKIKSSGELWAYDLFSMNDKNEVWLGYELFKNMIRKKKLKRHLDTVANFVESEIKQRRTIKFYVSCFTESEYNGRHCRVYGRENVGIRKESIKLCDQHIHLGLNSVNMNQFYILPVNYSRNVQERRLNDLVNSYVKLHDEIFLRFKQNGTEEMRHLLLGVFQTVVTLSALYKEQKYSWEKEFRGIVFHTTGEPLECSSGRKFLKLSV